MPDCDITVTNLGQIWCFYSPFYPGIWMALGTVVILKWKCCHFDEIFINGYTGCCQNDNIRCSQWWKFRHFCLRNSSALGMKSPQSSTKQYIYGIIISVNWFINPCAMVMPNGMMDLYHHGCKQYFAVAWHLVPPRHYLITCWLVISEILRSSCLWISLILLWM